MNQEFGDKFDFVKQELIGKKGELERKLEEKRLKEEGNKRSIGEEMRDLIAKLGEVTDEDMDSLEAELSPEGKKYFEKYDYERKMNLALIHSLLSAEEVERIYSLVSERHIVGSHNFNRDLSFLANYTNNNRYDFLKLSKHSKQSLEN